MHSVGYTSRCSTDADVVVAMFMRDQFSVSVLGVDFQYLLFLIMIILIITQSESLF